jgi:hypothetical protein
MNSTVLRRLSRIEAALSDHRASPPADAVALSRLAGIEPDDWQARVLTSTSDRLVLNCCRQSGKSTTVATLAVWTALAEAGALILLISPTLRQSGELFKKCLAVYRAARKPVASESESALTLRLHNGSRIVSLPGREGTVRGYSGVRLLVLDEAAWVPNALYVSLRPMLVVSQGRLVALSTPHGSRGWFYEAWVGGGDAWERYQITAADCPRISPAFLQEERRTLGDFWYQQEYECQFLSAATQVFSPDDLAPALARPVETWDVFGEAASWPR